MIRRLKSQVLQDLPQKTRSTILVESKATKEMSQLVKKHSEQGLMELVSRAMQSEGSGSHPVLLQAYHEAGLSKIQAVVAYIEELVESGAGYVPSSH